MSIDHRLHPAAQQEPTGPEGPRTAPKWLPLLAPIGAVGFTLAWAVLGGRSPGYQMWDIVVSSYSPISQPVSGLGLGETGNAMNASFVGCGLLVAGGTWATARTWPRTTSPRLRTWAGRLLPLCGVGMGVCGVFTLESITLHSLGFLLAIVAPAVGFVLAGRALRDTDPLLSRWLLAAGPLAIALMALFLATFDPEAAGDGEGYAGLLQRVLITLVLGTIAALGWRARGARALRG
jgi:hypothetical protein